MRRMLVAVICAVGVVGVPAVVLSAEATAASKPAATHVLRWPVIKRGARGPRVRVVQFLLNAHGAGVGVNAKFGPHTVLAVKAFQLVQGLKPSGQVNAATWTKLIIKVQRGSRGPAVRAVQRQLRSSEFGYFRVKVDARFGTATQAAVKSFQRAAYLHSDGVVGPATWQALVIGLF